MQALIKTLFISAYLLGATSALPTARPATLSPSSSSLSTRQAGSPPSCPASKAGRFEPDTYTIYPTEPDRSSARTQYLNLSRTATAVQEQVYAFRGLPATAQNCTLRWAVGAERVFHVNGSGLTEVHQLTGVPAAGAPVTYTAVQALLGARVGGGDFTAWNEVNGSHAHIVGSVPCAVDMAFTVRMGGQNNGSVQIKQSYEDGWYVEYDC